MLGDGKKWKEQLKYNIQGFTHVISDTSLTTESYEIIHTSNGISTEARS